VRFQKRDLVWIETPSNPTCRITNVKNLQHRAHSVGAVVIVDATFAPPPLQFPLSLGADMVMHSATKYLGGHSDMLMGALIVSSRIAQSKLIEERTSLGSTPGSLETWLLLRSLRTLKLRVQAQSETAEYLASSLVSIKCGVGRNQDTKAIESVLERVFHPTVQLKDNGAHWIKDQMKGGYGGILSIQLKSREIAEKFISELRYWKHATSLGGVESLVDHRYKWDQSENPGLLRLSCGLENKSDLLEDLLQAFITVAKHTST